MLTFTPELAQRLPETAALLRAGMLTLHPTVERVVLSGSRGLNGTPRPDSDIDLSLVIARSALPADEPAREQLLRTVLQTTLTAWAGPVECDLAAVYDLHGCGLNCLAGSRTAPPLHCNEQVCEFGVYKLQKGFSGYVPWPMIVLERMYPIFELWRRSCE